VSSFVALLDANVLFSYPVAVTLLDLAEQRMFRPAWSDEIHEEWIRAVVRKRPTAEDRLRRMSAAMNAAFPDARVTGYGRLVAALELPDPNDRHVLAAAIRAKAGVIVTANERDFPVDVLAGFQMTTQHPDVFLGHLIDLAPAVVREQFVRRVESLKQPPTSLDDYITKLERAGLPASAAQLRTLCNSSLG
jgi:predicted nucleic acid-binding protein